MHGLFVSLNDKKSIIVVNAFQNILNSSKRNSNKIWVGEGSEFYNKSRLKDNIWKTIT